MAAADEAAVGGDNDRVLPRVLLVVRLGDGSGNQCKNPICGERGLRGLPPPELLLGERLGLFAAVVIVVKPESMTAQALEILS